LFQIGMLAPAKIKTSDFVLHDGRADWQLIVPPPIMTKNNPALGTHLGEPLVIRRLLVKSEFVSRIMVILN
jgi:hypothetical protein